MHLLNKNFFKFVYGFLGMISIGLLGVVVVGHFMPENKAAADDVTEKPTETITTVDDSETDS